MSALVRAVNFHATPARHAGRIERQLASLARRFAPLGEDDVLRRFETGRRPGGRPGVIVAFFNGYADNAAVAAPILERLGLVGWFFIPSAFVATPARDQRAFAGRRGIGIPAGAPDPVAMAPDTVVRLAERHVIASHTRSHRALTGMTPAEAAAEIGGSKRDLEALCGRPVRTFAGLLGGAAGADPVIDAALRDAGYELLFANHAIQRLAPAGA